MLEAIGVTPDEERTYRALLAQPATSRAELSRTLGVGVGRVRRALDGLEVKGLVSRSPRPAGGRFVATPPDVGIDALIAHRHEELERVRGAGRSLMEEFRRSEHASAPRELVEVIEGATAIGQRFDQLQQGARREVLILDRPPYSNEFNRIEFETLKRGIAYRTLYDREALERPRILENVERYIAAGEEARVIDGVPLKLALVDGGLGLIPLDPGHTRNEAALVRSSSLVTGLRLLFEMLWERGVPVGAPSADGEPGAPSGEDHRILVLLAAGLKDEAIARRLGLGLRTVRRRVAALMEQVEATNRFQLGLHAERRGWL